MKVALALMAILAVAVPGRADDPRPAALRSAGIVQRMGARVPLDLAFRDETGRLVELGEYFGGKPVILVLAYFRCPKLCNQVLNGLVHGLKQMGDLRIGDQLTVLTVSFDPKEDPELAAAKKKAYVAQYGDSGAEAGWHFLTGKKASIDRLADAVGFRYAWDEERMQYIHASGIMVLTPAGRIARYFFGIRYEAKDLRFGLIEASDSKIGSPVDKALLLFCYSYDPVTGTYKMMALNLVRLGGAVTVILLATCLFVAWRREKRRGTIAGSRKRGSPLGSTMFAVLQLFPEQASTHAERVDQLFFFLLAVSGFFSVLIAGLIIFFAVKYRRRPENQWPVAIHGSLRLEAIWTGIPFALAMLIFYWGAKLYFDIVRPPENCMEIYVVGKQWMWKIQHQHGQREINRLTVPVGQPVKLTLISQDVIHDFAIPAFRIKQDVLPGRYTTTWFEATKPGEYHIFCDQYCGTNHSAMIGTVVVMPRAEFEQWLDRGPDDSLAARGGRLFRKLQCITCHSMNAEARAPVLEGLYGRRVHLKDGRSIIADDDYLRRSILYPDADIVDGFEPIMPAYDRENDGLGEEELQQLVTYIKALGQADTPQRIERSAPPRSVKKPKEKNP